VAAAGIDVDEFPPDGLLMIMMAIPTQVALQSTLGVSTGHEHALMLVERYLSQLRGAPLRRTTTTRSPKKAAKKVKKRATKKTTKRAPKRTSKSAK
jgi:hypothetical protein